MVLVYLPSAVKDIAWMRRYYTTVFPSGAEAARQQVLKAESVLLAHPQAGHAIKGVTGVREFVIPKTPFSYIYRIKADRIEVLRVWDERGDPDNLEL